MSVRNTLESAIVDCVEGPLPLLLLSWLVLRANSLAERRDEAKIGENLFANLSNHVGLLRGRSTRLARNNKNAPSGLLALRVIITNDINYYYWIALPARWRGLHSCDRCISLADNLFSLHYLDTITRLQSLSYLRRIPSAIFTRAILILEYRISLPPSLSLFLSWMLYVRLEQKAE